MNQITSCNRRGCQLSTADIESEQVTQDGMCIECRNHVAQCKEEEAVASFCQFHSKGVADWHAEVLTKCGFTYISRIPEDINQTCMELRYGCGLGLFLIFTCLDGNFIKLNKTNHYYPERPDWQVVFGLETPVPVILATIKAALDHEAK